jgi:hypothetical protein
MNPKDLLGVVLSWSAPVITPSGYRKGGTVGRVKLDDGRMVEARWSEQATIQAQRRPTAVGQRVSLSRDGRWGYRATLVERVVARSTTPTPERAPLPPLLARAVAAALAAGESPWTIAARHGLDVRQLSALPTATGRRPT